MDDSIETDADKSDDKIKRLPNLKKWLQPEYEELWCNILEILLSSGVPYEYYEVKDIPINPWQKVYNGLWDDVVRVFKNYETSHGSKRLYYTKTKIMNDILPALSDQYDTDIKQNNNPLPSFIMAKNMHNDYISML